MVLKSRSIMAIIGLALICLLTFGVGAKILLTSDGARFAEDGYVLTAEAQEGDEQKTVSSKLWFSQGSKWTNGAEEVSFTDVEGNALTIAPDSFIHYGDNSVSSVKEATVLDLDHFVDGIIQYYTLDAGGAVQYADGSFLVGEGGNTAAFSDYLMKSSESRCLLGSSELSLVQPEVSERGGILSDRFAEVEWLSEDKSIVLVNDGVNAWQFLSEGAYIELANGVRLDLATGELYLPSADGDGSSYPSGIGVADLDLDLDAKLTVYGNDYYPSYRFTVYDGEDGADGADGENGADGETGADGEAGAEGEQGVQGGEGTAGDGGKTGEAALGGYSGVQLSGLTVLDKVPVVTITDWQQNGKTLKFTLYADEDAANSIVEETTTVILYDITTGEEVYRWDADEGYVGTGEGLDLSEDSSDGYELWCSALTPGHEYRLTVDVDYLLNDTTAHQTVLSRVFAADDYGVSFDLLSTDNKSFTFALTQSNSLVEIADTDANGKPLGVAWSLDGETFTSIGESEFESFEIPVTNDSEANPSGEEYEVTFRVYYRVKTFDSEGELIESIEGPIYYTQTISTLKQAPTLGGVRLTAYNSGHFLAEALGKATSNGVYGDVEDEDDAIESIRFELYDCRVDTEDFQEYSAEEKKSHLVSTQTASDGYIAYFPVSQGGVVEPGKRYYLMAYYIYNDGEKTVESPILETWEHNSTAFDGNGSKIDDQYASHKESEAAWDTGCLVSVQDTTLTFVGSTEIYNLPSAEDPQRLEPGITYNSITGTLELSLNSGNTYWISSKYPMELQISGKPDYSNSLSFTALNNFGELQTLATATELTALAGYSEIKIPVDLDGLKADTIYMFTLYGYAASSVDEDGKNPQGLTRMIMGSVAITTSEEKNLSVSIYKTDAVKNTDGAIGFNFVLNIDDGANYYGDEDNYQDSKEYLQEVAASYRSLYSLTFELCMEGASDNALGSVTIYNKYADSSTTRNSLYEDYYGWTAMSKTWAGKKDANDSLYATVGVGKSNYEYYFQKADGTELSNLPKGTYYIRVSAAYDYTQYRYEYMINPENTLRSYDYYAYSSSSEGDYMNQLKVNGSLSYSFKNEELQFRLTELPFLTPAKLIYNSGDENGTYLKVDYIYNNDKTAAEYNWLSDQNTLYSEEWAEGTKVGVKLRCQYVNDSPDFSTESISFYVFRADTYEGLTAGQDPTSSSGSYAFKCTIPMAANEMVDAPEVWIMTYDPDDVPGVFDAYGESGSNLESGYDDNGYEYYYFSEPQSDGTWRYVYYVSEKAFCRGYHYYFAFDAYLPGLTYTDYLGREKTEDFYYPRMYYENMIGNEGGFDYSDVFWSRKIEMERQAPVAYTMLESTSRNRTTGLAEDSWKLYVHDPDGAIWWPSILENGYSLNSFNGQQIAAATIPGYSVVMANQGSGGNGAGGIWSSSGNYRITDPVFTAEGSDGKEEDSYLTFTFRSDSGDLGVIIDTNTILNPFADGSTEDQATDIQKQILDGVRWVTEQNLSADQGVEWMLTKRTQNSNGEAGFEARGGTLTVSNLPDDGLAYQMLADYRLLDDEEEWETPLVLVSHYYSGYVEYDAEDEPVFLVDGETSEDNDTVTIYIGASEADLAKYAEEEDGPGEDFRHDYYATLDYLKMVRAITAVKLCAYITGEDGEKRYIIERKDNGELNGDEKKILWLAPKAPVNSVDTSDRRYTLTFKLSDLDDSAGELQYSPNDQMGFELTVYYATGESVEIGTDYPTTKAADEGTAALKYMSPVDSLYLYVNAQDQGVSTLDSPRYLSTSSGGAVAWSDRGAGGSLFNVKGVFSTEGELPWTQQISIQSKTMDTGGNMSTSGLTLTPVNLRTVFSNGANESVLEAIQVASYTCSQIRYINAEGKTGTTGMSVRPAVPSLADAKITAGITSLNLQATVNNYSLVLYPSYKDGSRESLHLYYVLSKLAADGNSAGEAVAVMVGEPDGALADGRLNISFTGLESQQDYYLEVYYKDEEEGGDDYLPDSALFSGIDFTPGTQYAANNTTGAALITAITGTDSSVFQKISGMSGHHHGQTMAKLALGAVTFSLGNKAKYDEKLLSVATKVTTDIVEEERESLGLYYRLERCEAGQEDEEDAWKTVIGHEELSDRVENWEVTDAETRQEDGSYWGYYGSEVSAAEIKSDNTMVMNYHAGGKIVPGYSYRMVVEIYQKVDGAYTSVSDEAVSNSESWSAVNAADNTIARVLNVSCTGNSITMNIRLTDSNYTNLDERYFVRLAKKESDGTYTVLEGDGWRDVYIYSNENLMTKAFRMITPYNDSTYSYTVKFGSSKGLESDTTYRLQFYALLDPDFDNYVNLTGSGSLLAEKYEETPVLDLAAFYPRGDGKAEKLGSNIETLEAEFYSGLNNFGSPPTNLTLAREGATVMVGYSTDITTLSSDVTATVGNYDSVKVDGTYSLQVRYNDAINASYVTKIEYSLARVSGEDARTWPAVTLTKGSADISMFSSLKQGTNQGTDGSIYLSLDLSAAAGEAEGDELDDSLPNLSEYGTYSLVLIYYTGDEKSGYVRLSREDIMFRFQK